MLGRIQPHSYLFKKQKKIYFTHIKNKKKSDNSFQVILRSFHQTGNHDEISRELDVQDHQLVRINNIIILSHLQDATTAI